MNSFRHSGKLGDIIYSLPAVRALDGGSYFIDHRTEYFRKPPLGEQTARMMVATCCARRIISTRLVSTTAGR
jgi:hypothetical protein